MQEKSGCIIGKIFRVIGEILLSKEAFRDAQAEAGYPLDWEPEDEA